MRRSETDILVVYLICSMLGFAVLILMLFDSGEKSTPPCNTMDELDYYSKFDVTKHLLQRRALTSKVGDSCDTLCLDTVGGKLVIKDCKY